MNKEELIRWFNNKFYSCYYVVHSDYPDSIFMYYDEQIVRSVKLSKLSGVSFHNTKVKGVCLFEQDWKNKRFYCNYNYIWMFLSNNFSSKYEDIQLFVDDRLSEFDKMNVLTSGIIDDKREIMLSFKK